MNRNILPLLLMLIAGVATCIYTFILRYSTLDKLIALFIVLLVFYFLGSILKWTLDYFEEQIEKQQKEEGEVIEKGAEGQEEIQEEAGEEAREETVEEESESQSPA